MREVTLRREAELEADIRHRRLAPHEPVERPLDPHGVGIERRGYAGVFAEELEEMWPRQPGVARHVVEFDPVGDAVVENAQRFAHAKIDRLREPRGKALPASGPPGLVEARIKQLIEVAVDDAIAGVCYQRVR